MKKILIYQIDAFANEVFSGNPAAVCPLDEWLGDELMQAIAAENNLSETAFFVGADGEYDLRWFTPTDEVDLCGHATLASAYVVFNDLHTGLKRVSFNTRSGLLCVDKLDGALQMDFPLRIAMPVELNSQLMKGLHIEPLEVLLAAEDYLVVYKSESDVAALQPDFVALKTLPQRGIIATAPGERYDFVSRFFGPKVGIDEDPVTGSAHCTLVPYWAERLGKNELSARQISKRGGDVYCLVADDRVYLKGNCVKYMQGEIFI